MSSVVLKSFNLCFLNHSLVPIKSSSLVNTIFRFLSTGTQKLKILNLQFILSEISNLLNVVTLTSLTVNNSLYQGHQQEWILLLKSCLVLVLVVWI